MAGKRRAKDLFDGLENYGGDGGVIALSMGAPGKQTLSGCCELIAEATTLALSDPEDEKHTFQYGPSKGDPGFCDEMASFLTTEYGDTVHSEDIVVTAGATQGLHFIATTLFSKDMPVFIEDPTYFIAVKMLKEDFGMNIVPVRTDKEGMDMEQLETFLQQYKPTDSTGCTTSRRPFWGMIYTVPTFNNPKGFCMSPERCKALVKLARKYGVLVLAEDVYNLLHYRGNPHCPPRLLSYDNRSDADFEGHVISNGTFSKMLAPGLRLGWIEAPPRIMSCILSTGVIWSGGSFNHYTSKVAAAAMKSGSLKKHLHKVRDEYAKRMDMACSALEKNLPSSVKVDNPGGGFFIWLELPPRIDAIELLKLSVNKYQVNFIFGASTSPTGGCTNCVRLSISYCETSKIEEGIVRFCNAVKDMLNSS